MKYTNLIAGQYKEAVTLAWANRKRQHNALHKAEVAKRNAEMYGDKFDDSERHLDVAKEFERKANEYALRASAYRSHLDYLEKEAKNAKAQKA